MGFLKLDETILRSSIWVMRDDRDIFITALLMARPKEFSEPVPAFQVDSLDESGFIVPAGKYGFIEAAGTGIVRMSGLEMEEGLAALKRLGEPDPESRNQKFEGRRLVRVDHGYVALNYGFYRDKDHTAAKRMRNFRARQKVKVRRQSKEDREREGALAAQGVIRGAEAAG